MNEEVLKRLDALASKLNTTGAHLWEVLVKQARIEAIEWVCWALFWFALTYLSYKGGMYVYKRCEEPSIAVKADKVFDLPEWRGRGSVEIFVGLFIVALVALVFGVACLSGLPGMFLNPEYWALKKVMESLK